MSTFILLAVGEGRTHHIGTYELADPVSDEAASAELIEQFGEYRKQICVVNRCEFDMGVYQPRMARPVLSSYSAIGVAPQGPLYSYAENIAPPLPHDDGSLATALNQLSVLVRDLTEIMRHIEPVPSNMSCYGQLTRSTLITASMEVENEFRGILAANSYAQNARLSTNDFVKLKDPLRLDEYNVELTFYPKVRYRNPFINWDTASPTQSLNWYDSYNAVKHDRSQNFSRATLENAIDSVVAFAILLAAQYRIIPVWRDQIGDFFKFHTSPRWEMKAQYHPGDEGWVAKPYFS